MSVAPDVNVAIQDRFARELPELRVRWRAEAPPDPRLLVLNESLAADLGLDLAWLRGLDGMLFPVGNLVSDEAVPGWRRPTPDGDTHDRATQPDQLLQAFELEVDAQPAEQVGRVGAAGRQEPTPGVLAAQRCRREQPADERVAVAHGTQQQPRGGRRLPRVAPQAIRLQRVDKKMDA